MANVNLDFERRQHLANWLIKSGPHMAKIPVIGGGGGKKTLMGPTPSNPLWLPQGVFKPAQCLGLASGSPFTSQTNLNLPLQIFTAPAYEGHKPKLRRFNSHDTSANMFSVTEFENNARMAKQQSKQQQCDSMNRKNSSNDYYSTSRESSGGHSRAAAAVAEEEPSQEIMPIDKFLLKSVLPKVVRVYSPNEQGEQLTALGGGSHGRNGERPDGGGGDKQGRLMFIYRHIPNRKIFKAHNSKSSDKRRCLKIPQELKGYFSMVNEKGQPTATMYSKVIELVRERVYKFLTLDNMVAYNESFSEVIPMKSQYVKTTIKAGQTFRILAVFEDDRSRNNHQKNGSGSTAGQTDREKIRGRYVQILSETRQMFYVPLTTKGKFYEVAVNSSGGSNGHHQQSQSNSQARHHNGTTTGSSGGGGGGGINQQPHHFEVGRKQDYVYRISDLVLNNSSLPLNLKLIYAPSFVDLPDYITVEDMSREDILLGCAIAEKDASPMASSKNTPLSLAKLTVFPDIKLQKSLMGHRDERRLLASPMFQHWIEFCKTHSEIRLQAVEIEYEEKSSSRIGGNSTNSNSLNHLPLTSSSNSNGGAGSPPPPPPPSAGNGSNNSPPSAAASQQGKRSKVESLKLLRPLSLAKFLGRDKNYVAHEVEDSIIFLTKSDLEKIEAQKGQQAAPLLPAGNGGRMGGSTSQLEIGDKMKVFEQEKRGGWFSDRKNQKKGGKTKSFTSYDILNRKLTANDRYCDMSKMLQERFGDLSTSTLMKNSAAAAGGATKGGNGGGGGGGGGVNGGPNKSSSVTDISAGNTTLLGSRYSINKTFSLENLNLYDMQPRSRHSFSTSQTPDLVRIINQQALRGSAASSVENIGQLYPTTSSSQGLSSIGGGGGGPAPSHRDESFISEKLYNEFHVKTKQHSKSSTHLNRWPFNGSRQAVPMMGGGGGGFKEERSRSQGGGGGMKRTSSIVNITSDYSSVQDSLVDVSLAPPSRITILHKAREAGGAKEFINTNTDEFYAEICNGGGGGGLRGPHHHHHHNHTSRTQIVNVL